MSEAEEIYRRAESYDYGLGNTPKDPEHAFELYKKAAQMKYGPAAYELGRDYEFGYGTEKNISKALSWYKNAIAWGSADAYNAMGQYYLKKEQAAQAFDYFKKGSEAGSRLAMVSLGDWYGYEANFTHDGNEQANFRKAFRCYARAAELGSSKAMYELAMCYMLGQGCSIDKYEMVRWMKKAAEKGNSKAMEEVGEFYFRGDRGLQRDWEQSFYWRKKAAEHGEPRAMYKVGCMYHLGRGVNRDTRAAKYWFKKGLDAARASGDDSTEDGCREMLDEYYS